MSLPALSAVWWDCVMTAMPGMPKAYTPIVCVLSLGVSEEHPLAKLTMPPPIDKTQTMGVYAFGIPGIAVITQSQQTADNAGSDTNAATQSNPVEVSGK